MERATLFSLHFFFFLVRNIALCMSILVYFSGKYVIFVYTVCICLEVIECQQ